MIRHPFLLLALVAGSVTAANAAELVKVKYDTPLDIRAGNATARAQIEVLYALPDGSAAAVLSNSQNVAPFKSLTMANLNSMGEIRRTDFLNTANEDSLSYNTSAIDTTGRLYLSTDSNLVGGTWFRFSATGARLATRTGRSVGSSMIVEPFGTSYRVSGVGMGIGAVTRWDQYGTLKSYASYQGQIANQYSRSFFDPNGNIDVIATGRQLFQEERTSFILKVSKQPAILAHIPLPLAQDEFIEDAGRDKDGNFVAVVTRIVDNTRYRSLRKFRGVDGTQLWTVDLATGVLFSFALDGQGRSWIARPTGTGTGMVRQFSKSGVINWTSELPTTSAVKVILDSSDEAYVIGNSADFKAVMVKFAGNGIARFAHTVVDATGRLAGRMLAVDNESGNIYMGMGYQPDPQIQSSYPRIRCLWQAPFVRNDSFNVPANQATRPGSVIANDSYRQGAQLTIVRQPAHGSLAAVSQDGTFTYTPNAGFVGQDSFTYRLNRGTLASFTATAYLNVQ